MGEKKITSYEDFIKALRCGENSILFKFRHGESREELLQRIEQCRQELIEAGENPDEYFKPVEPQRAAVYYFPNGLH